MSSKRKVDRGHIHKSMEGKYEKKRWKSLTLIPNTHIYKYTLLFQR